MSLFFLPKAHSQKPELKSGQTKKSFTQKTTTHHRFGEFKIIHWLLLSICLGEVTGVF